MKVIHDLKNDFLSIDFKDEVEAKSQYIDGIIVRFDKKGAVIGIDITDSSRLFAGQELVTLQEASALLGISESTLRRKIKAGEIPFTKKGKDYRFKKSDLLKLAA